MKSNTENENRAADVLAQLTQTALKNYEHAVRTGLKMQEEAGQCWSSILDGRTCLNQGWSAQLAKRLAPFAEQRAQDMMEWVQRSGRTSTDLMRKAVEAAETADAGRRQAQWLELWSASISAVRNQAEATTALGSRSFEAWMELVQSQPAGS